MAGHIVFAGWNINYIINEIKVSNQMTHHTSEYIGQKGSATNYVSSQGRVISFTNICKKSEDNTSKGHRINAYKYLAETYSKTPKVLTSPSQSRLNGNYIVTKFDFTEDTQGNFICDWEFTEVMKFNVTSKTFRVWGKSVSSSNKAKKTTTKTSSTNSSNLSSNVKLLLKSCPLMSEGSSSKKCVKSLQKFLQSKGYYKNYKVDGIFAIYTKQELKKLQKSIKVKATGKWDKATRNYFQKKYKYPTESKKKK